MGKPGNLAFEISESDFKLYQNILDELIIEKFKYKNRIMQKLQYSYKYMEVNKYNKFLTFLEDIAEYAIFQKMFIRGNKEVNSHLKSIRNKIINQFGNTTSNDYFYKEKEVIVNSIIKNTFNENQYGNLTYVVLNLKEVYRYSNIPSRFTRKCASSFIYKYNY